MPGQRMAPEGVEDGHRQGNEHDVPHLARRVTDDSGENDDQGDQILGSSEDQGTDGGGEQAGFLRHAHAEEGDQHRAQGHEASEVGHQILADPANAVADHQASDRQQLTGRTGARIFDLKPKARGDRRGHDDAESEERKE